MASGRTNVSGGIGTFFGNGSSGTIPNLNLVTTAPNGGTVANLWDMNAGTTFVTSSLGAGVDVVVFQIDFGSSTLLTNLYLWQALVSTARTFAVQSSPDGSVWTQRATQALTTSATNYQISISNIGARYWRLVTTAGTAGAFTCQGVTINFITGDTQTTKVWRILEPSTLNGVAVVKQYTDFNLPVGYEITVQNPNQGLIIYSQNNITNAGVIDMNQKAGLAPNGNIIPMLLTKVNSSGVKTIDKYFKLTTVLQVLRGGAGGNGGYGGGFSGSTGRQSSVGTGGAGRQNLGGFGGGGSGGNGTNTSRSSQIGSSISQVDGGGNFDNSVWRMIAGIDITSYYVASNGLGGRGVAIINGQPLGVIGGALGTFGRLNGGGLGGTGGALLQTTFKSIGSISDSQYSGGFLMAIAKGNITNTGTIRANGGAGSNGSSAEWDSGQGNGAGGGGGGGGSGGGVIALFHGNAYSNTGTIQVNGGTGGTGGSGFGTGEAGGSGTSGSVGTIHTQKI